MQPINGCAFCRSNRKSWTGHTVEVCVELATVECGYCHQKGHTPKKCPKSALKKQREAEWALQNKKRYEEKQQKSAANWPSLPEHPNKYLECVRTLHEITVPINNKSTWSSLVVNSLSTEERERMEQQHLKQREQEAEERKKAAERKRKEWEDKKAGWEVRNQRRIEREYGLKKDNGICPAGSFWYFFTERTKDDTDTAKVLREDSNNQLEFKKYLKEKYWVNWLSLTECSEDDCWILNCWRWEEEKAENEREDRKREAVEEYFKQEEDMNNTIKAKVASGEITREEYDDWQLKKDINDDYSYQAEGDTMWYHHQKIDRYYEDWRERSEARKKK